MTDLDGKKEETEAAKKVIHTYPLIRHSDMVEEMKGEVMELVVTACEKHSTNNEMAARMIKETMDKKFGPSWHTVVGEGFGFEISYECFCHHVNEICAYTEKNGGSILMFQENLLVPSSRVFLDLHL